MPSRRYHTKSHHGCRLCKVKRVKCDEKRPACSRCSTRSQECVYKDSNLPASPQILTLTGHTKATEVRSESQDTSLAIVPSFPPSLYSDHMDEDTLRLHHHFANCTSTAFFSSSTEEDFETWVVSIRRHAVSHDFLYEGMLALASVHLGALQPASRGHHTAVALKHQITALGLFRQTLEDINHENCEAALAYSGLLIISEFALPLIQSKPGASSVGGMQELQGIINLFRGAKALYRLGWMHMLDKNLSCDLRSKVIATQFDEAVTTEAEMSLNFLATLEIVPLEDEALKAIYTDTLFKLKKNLRRVAAHPGVVSLVLKWPTNVLQDYVSMLGRYDPIALILLAYWAVGLHSIDHLWWARGWGKSIVDVAGQHIGAEWQHYIQWPLLKTG